MHTLNWEPLFLYGHGGTPGRLAELLTRNRSLLEGSRGFQICYIMRRWVQQYPIGQDGPLWQYQVLPDNTSYPSQGIRLGEAAGNVNLWLLRERRSPESSDGTDRGLAPTRFSWKGVKGEVGEEVGDEEILDLQLCSVSVRVDVPKWVPWQTLHSSPSHTFPTWSLQNLAWILTPEARFPCGYHRVWWCEPHLQGNRSTCWRIQNISPRYSFPPKVAAEGAMLSEPTAASVFSALLTNHQQAS